MVFSGFSACYFLKKKKKGHRILESIHSSILCECFYLPDVLRSINLPERFVKCVVIPVAPGLSKFPPKEITRFNRKIISLLLTITQRPVMFLLFLTKQLPLLVTISFNPTMRCLKNNCSTWSFCNCVFWPLLHQCCFLFNWNEVDLQYCIAFYCTAKWTGWVCVYICLCTCVCSFPLWLITGFFVFIYFYCNTDDLQC